MNTQRLFDLKGINYWYLVLGVSLNVIWTLALTLLIAFLFPRELETGSAFIQVLLLGASFVGPFLIGWLVGALAGGGRGPTYGFYGSLGAVLVMVFVMRSSGIVGMMMVVAAVAGGLNGGMFGLRRR